jgi:hypothetical protein
MKAVITRTIEITLLGSLISTGFGINKANAVSLGTFDFNGSQFGNTLIESDGGYFSSENWLNVNNSNPGNPAYLTGANFDTGIANIGLGGGNPIYTVGYGTPIVNGSGDDLGIVSARYSTGDTFQLSVSTDGINFTSPINFSPTAAIATGVNKSYYYGGGGPFNSELFVTPVDLSSFGISIGISVSAIRITGSPEADLIRVAGFGQPRPVPEPTSTLSLLALGTLGAASTIKRKLKSSQSTEKETTEIG